MSKQGGQLHKLIEESSTLSNSNKEIAAVQESLKVLLKHKEATAKSYKTATEKLKTNYNDIINEASKEADKIKAEAAKVLENAYNSAVEIKKVANAEAEQIRAKTNDEIKAWAQEKAKLEHIQAFKSQVKVDVGGFKFTTTIATLCRIPHSMLGAMFSGRHALPLNEEGYFFIDRDGTHFRLILNYLRSPETWKVDLPKNQLTELKTECEYYGLKDCMFPFTPAETTNLYDVYNRTYSISQDMEGLWYANDAILKVCRGCGVAQQTSILKSYFRDFNTGRTIAEEQPRAHPCISCRNSY